jgi:hypothetical protein
MDYLFLATFLQVEITRFKFGRSFTLTNPVIERAARKRYAEAVGISPKSHAKKFIASLGETYKDNNLLPNWEKALRSSGLDPQDFAL